MSDTTKQSVSLSPKPDNLKRLYRLREACEYLGIGRATMYNYLNAGTLKAFKPDGSRVWRFDKHELDAWIETQKENNSNG